MTTIFTQRFSTKTWSKLAVTFAVLLMLAGTAMTAALPPGGQPAVHAQDDQGAISNLQASSPNPGQLALAWNAPSEAPTDYRVRWAPTGQDYLSFSEANTAQKGAAPTPQVPHTR